MKKYNKKSAAILATGSTLNKNGSGNKLSSLPYDTTNLTPLSTVKQSRRQVAFETGWSKNIPDRGEFLSQHHLLIKSGLIVYCKGSSLYGPKEQAKKVCEVLANSGDKMAQIAMIINEELSHD